MKQREKELAGKASAGEGGSGSSHKQKVAGPAKESPSRLRDPLSYDEKRDDNLIASDDNTLAECDKYWQDWFDSDKNKQRDSKKMFQRFVEIFLPQGNL